MLAKLHTIFAKLIVGPLELAVVVSDWMQKHVGMGAAWLAIVVIIFGSGFIPVAALSALVGHVFGFNSHWIIVGVIGGIALDVFIIWADLQVAAH